jgi:hypothetical protein
VWKKASVNASRQGRTYFPEARFWIASEALTHCGSAIHGHVLRNRVNGQEGNPAGARCCVTQDQEVFSTLLGVFPAARQSAGDREQCYANRNQNQNLRPKVRERFIAPEHFRESINRPGIDRQQACFLQ